MVDQFYGGKIDTEVCDLLRAQTPPAKWIVYRVLHYPAHKYEPIGVLGRNKPDCAHCPLTHDMHSERRDRRLVLLLVNGPLRNLAYLTDKDSELPKAVRNWLHTLFNIAEAANVRLDAWAAYDGRSPE
jgi:hypothetical protein